MLMTLKRPAGGIMYFSTNRTNLFAIILVVAGLLISCSGNSDPVAPSQSPDTLTTQVSDTGASASGNHYPWGFYNVYVDPGEGTWDIEPLRQVADHFNIINYLEQWPCSNCFQLVGIQQSGSGTLLVDVQITHPFATKPNFTGFDVRGIAMFDGNKTFPVSGLVKSFADSGQGVIVDPDGYTTLYNTTTEGSGPSGLQGYIKGKFGTLTYPQATLNPFKRFSTDNVANTRNVFVAGDQITVQYEVKMPTPGGFIFGYAIDACWVPPTTKPVTNPIVDFGADANCPEPWKIEITDEPVGPGMTAYGGSTVLTIDVYDWQEGTHAAPVVECPEIFIDTQTAVKISDNGDYSTYQVTVTKTELATIGLHECLISVEDDENASAPEWLDLTAYYVHELEVFEYAFTEPFAQAGAEPNPQDVCQDVNFYNDGSYDPDGGSIVNYQWDWDNDGVYDEEGADVYHSWDMSGTYYVQFKVTDDEGQFDELDTPLEIVIDNILPTAEGSINLSTVPAGGEIIFDGSSSHDNDCGGDAIVLWEWDMGSEQYSTASPDPLPIHLANWGYYDAILTVTDDEGGTDEIDEPLSFRVSEGWAATWGGSTYDAAYDAVADSLGNVYVTGFFNDTVDFDPGDGVVEVTSNGGKDCYLCMYNPMGEFQWVKTWGSGTDDVAYALDTYGDTAVYVVGYFTGSNVDFDPDLLNEELLDSNGQGDAFIVKFDMLGNFQWAWNWGGAEYDACLDVSADNFENIFISGKFKDSNVDFDPDPSFAGQDMHSSNGLYDAFLMSFLPDGDFRWARTWGSTGDDEAHGVYGGSNGKVAVSGLYRGTVNFDTGGGTDEFTSVGEEDAFVSQYSAIGAYEWNVSYGSANAGDIGRAVTIDSTDKICLVGTFTGTVDFDPGPDAFSIPSNGSGDAFYVKLTTTGTFVGARTWGGISNDEARTITEDTAGNQYVGGTFVGSGIDLDPGPGTDLHSSNANSIDIFVIGFSPIFVYSWAQSWGGESTDYCNSLASFEDLFIFPAGEYKETVDFDLGDHFEDWHVSEGITDAWIGRLRYDGNW